MRELGGTMIYVTHDQVEAMTLADRIVVLSAGRIEQVGTPLELYHKPANRFVAGFIGSPRMNFIPQATLKDAPAAAVIDIRPEHIDVVTVDAADAHLTVEIVEQLGGETYLYGALRGWQRADCARPRAMSWPSAATLCRFASSASGCICFDNDGALFRRSDASFGVSVHESSRCRELSRSGRSMVPLRSRLRYRGAYRLP